MAVRYVKNAISDLLVNHGALLLLVIMKGLTRTRDDDEVKKARGEITERMHKRDVATNGGDRVYYVIIEAARGARLNL